jgi:exodeoxyribonuclease VII small subunit
MSDEQADKKRESSFEDALNRLERIVKELEEGTRGLDSSIQLYEEGRRLVQVCTKKLDEAQGRIERLVQSDAGLGTEPAAVSGLAAGQEGSGEEESEGESNSEVLSDDGLPF